MRALLLRHCRGSCPPSHWSVGHQWEGSPPSLRKGRGEYLPLPHNLSRNYDEAVQFHLKKNLKLIPVIIWVSLRSHVQYIIKFKFSEGRIRLSYICIYIIWVGGALPHSQHGRATRAPPLLFLTHKNSFRSFLLLEKFPIVHEIMKNPSDWKSHTWASLKSDILSSLSFFT